MGEDYWQPNLIKIPVAVGARNASGDIHVMVVAGMVDPAKIIWAEEYFEPDLDMTCTRLRYEGGSLGTFAGTVDELWRVIYGEKDA